MDAEIQANHMLKYQELKFKSCLPKLSEVLADAQARMPSKVRNGYVFSGLQELKDTAQRNVLKADLVNVAQLVSTNKSEFLIEDRDAVNSVRKDTKLIANPMRRSNSASQVEFCDCFDGAGQCNYLMFRKRFHLRRDKVSDGGNANQWQQDLRPDVVVPPRPSFRSNCNFRLHLAN